MRDTILVVTDSREPNVPVVVQNYLSNQRVFCLNTDSLVDCLVTTKVDDNVLSFIIENGSAIISSEEIKSIWYRRPSKVSLPSNELSGNLKEFAEKEFQRFLMATWHSFSDKDVTWVSHPLALTRVESNKLLQTKIASQFGLATPKTLVTNNVEEARKFFIFHQDKVIMKTCGSNCLMNDSGDLEGVFANPLTEDDLDHFGHDLKYSPVIFQNYVPKKLELRITIVGKQVMACAIHSQDSPLTKDDWRHYDLKRVRHEPFKLPHDVEDKLLSCMREWGLQFGAIDMILTPEDEYVFLEVNPSGQWGWIEALTGLPICQAVANLLSNPVEYAL